MFRENGEKKKEHLHIPKRILSFIILFGMILGTLVSGTKADAAAIKIKYDGKIYSYSSAQAKVTLDKKNINLGGTPAVIIDNICMVPGKAVFGNGINAKYSYNSATKKIEITKNDVKIEMTLNSKTAYVNGVKKTLDAAPKNIKFYDKNVTKVYLPSKSVAEALGYGYKWNSAAKAADMTSPFVIKYEKDWITYKGVQGKVSFDGETVSLTEMPTIILNNTTLVPADSVFKEKAGASYSYDKTAKTVTILQNDVEIVMTIDSKEAFVNGVNKKMNTPARVVYNKQNNKSFVMVPGEFVATSLGYDYKWNSTTKTSAITSKPKPFFSKAWQNLSDVGTMITAIEGIYSEGADVISITGTDVLDIEIIEIDNRIQLNINNVYNQIEIISESIVNGHYVSDIQIEPWLNGIQINVDKTSTSDYYTMKTGNIFKLVVCKDADQDILNSTFQLKMDLPEDVDYSTIITEDLYYDKKFTITLFGDYLDYFNNNPIKYNDDIVKSVNVELDKYGDTVITVKTYKLQGFKLKDCISFVGVNIGNPNTIYDKIVVLDAGHGGTDPGAKSKGVSEKDLNHTIIYECAKKYFNGSDSDIKAYWTRHDDTFITLDARAAYAASLGADLFISLHMNSATASASGTEIYYSKSNNAVMGTLTSKEMATIFYKQLIDDLEMNKRGVKSAEFIVIKKNSVPAVLIELGFLTNSKDLSSLTDPDFQDSAAKSIYDATVSIFDTYQTNR